MVRLGKPAYDTQFSPIAAVRKVQMALVEVLDLRAIAAARHSLARPAPALIRKLDGGYQS